MVKYHFFIVIFLEFSLLGQKKFILTGAPGCGKTTIITILKEKGFQVVPEAYETLYKELYSAGKWKDSLAYQDDFRFLLLNKQKEMESKLDVKRDTFLDRSAYDIIFFGYYYNIQMSENIINVTKVQGYDLIFFVKELPEEFYQNTSMRLETRAKAIKIGKFLKKLYLNLPITIIEVPFDTPENRANFIIDKIKYLLGK